jgi:perosamine synthetase
MEKMSIGVGTLQLNDKSKKNVMTVLESNRLSYGPFSKRFESEFSNIHGCKYGVLSNSGTSSLQVALAALKEKFGWADGDEVLVPAVTFIATSNIVIHNNMKPVFVDVEKDYYEIDPKLIEEKITDKTRAIIPVHLFGHPCDMGPIMEIADKHGLKVIEDSCETMFAKYNGKSVGSFGDIGCFSTYVAHLMVTGVGGFSLTNNEEYDAMMRSIVNHGRDSIYISIDDDKNKSNDEMSEIISKRFSFVRLGHSFRITEMESAVGLGQLDGWKDMITRRREIAKFLIDKLSRFSEYIQLPKIRDGSEHSFMMFPIVVKNENKDKLVGFLECNGIETRDMLPLINQPIYKKLFSSNEDDYPVAKWINGSGFYIGCHQNLTTKELDYIIDIFIKFFS